MKFNFKKILAGFMAVSMSLSALYSAGTDSFAAGSSDELKTWSGKTANFDTWDGSSYNYDWLKNGVGDSADNPYEITSAAQLASLSTLTASSENYTDNSLQNTVGGLKTDAAYRLKWAYGTPGTLDPVPGGYNSTFYAIAKNAATNDKNSWYTYTTPDLGIKFEYQTDSSGSTDKQVEFQKPFFQYETNDFTFLDLVGNESTGTEFFITKACLPLVINGEKVYVDILDALREYYTTTNGSYKVFFEPNVLTDKDKIYSHDDYSAHTGSMSNCTYYNVYRDIQYIEYTAADAKLSVKIGNVSKFIGYPKDFGLPNFPAVTAKNSKGDEISIDSSNVGEYYLPNRGSVTMPADKKQSMNFMDKLYNQTSATTTVPLATANEIQTARTNALDADSGATTASLDFDVTYVIPNMTPFTNSTYLYYLSSQEKASGDFLADDEAWFFRNNTNKARLAYRITGTFSFNPQYFYERWSSKWCYRGREGQIKNVSIYLHSLIDGDNYDNDKLIVQNITSQNNLVYHNTGRSPNDNSISLKLTWNINSAGKLSITNTIPFDYSNGSWITSTPYQAQQINADTLGFNRLTTFHKISGGNNAPAQTIELDAEKRPVFAGCSNDFPDNVKIYQDRYKYVNVTLPAITETAKEHLGDIPPTFGGKYFKLTKNIDVQNLPAALFPETEKSGKGGMAADFDLNGHVIKTNRTLFGTILREGALHDSKHAADPKDGGAIVACGNIPSGIIFNNRGSVKAVDFMSENVFNWTKPANTMSSPSACFIGSNEGNVDGCRMVVGRFDAAKFIGDNYGEITEAEVWLAADSFDGGEDASNGTIYFAQNNKGTVDGVKFVSANSYRLGRINIFKVVSGSGNVKNLQLGDPNGNAVEIYNGSSGSISNIIEGSGNITDSNINFKLDCTNTSPNYGCINGFTLENCSIKLEGYMCIAVQNATVKNSTVDFKYKKAENDSNYMYAFQNTNFYKCKVSADDYSTTSYFFNNVSFYDNCEVSVNKAENLFNYFWQNSGTNCFMENSTLTIGKLSLTNSNNYSSILSGNSTLDSTKLTNSVIHIKNADFGKSQSNTGRQYGFFNCVYVKNSDIIVDNATGDVPDFISTSGYVRDSRVHVNISGEFRIAGTSLTTNYVNSGNEYYYYFDHNAKGAVNGFWGAANHGSQCQITFTDSLLYVGEMPDGVYVSGDTLAGGGYWYTPAYGTPNKKVDTNLTIITPKLNVKIKGDTSGTPCGLFSLVGMSPYANNPPSTINNLCGNYFYAKVYVQDPENCCGVTGFGGMYSGYDYRSSNKMNLCTDNVFDINVYSNNTDSNIPAHAFAFASISAQTRINNSILRSNSTSAKSSLVNVYNSNPGSFSDNNGLLANLTGNNTNYDLIIRSSVLSLPNTPKYTEGATSGEYPGFVNSYYGYINHFSGENKTKLPKANEVQAAFISRMQQNGKIAIINCYVPDGQSSLYTNFDGINRFNLFNQDLSTISGEYNGFKNNLKAYEETIQEKDITDSINSPSALGVHTFTYDSSEDTNADLSGELAYTLDWGSADRRSYDWTVAENCFIDDTYTGKQIHKMENYTVPAKVLNLPEGSLEEDFNLKPVFKTTVNYAQGGYVQLQGINGKTVKAADAEHSGVIYTKQGEAIIEKEEATQGDFAYATHKLGTAYPSIIESCPTTHSTGYYSILGYRQQSVDTVITPVFAQRRNITVNINNLVENKEYEGSTLIAPAYSYEGLVVNLTPDLKFGETLINVKASYKNDKGIDVEIPITNLKFLMPDTNVIITADCIDFKGGITKFSLFGSEGEIDQVNHTIFVSVPRTQSLSNARPEIEFLGNRVDPSKSAFIDFTKPVKYTVYYGDYDETVTYTVTVKQSVLTMRIMEYEANGVKGEIDNANHTITLKMPPETDIQHITPSKIVYSADSITPAPTQNEDGSVTHQSLNFAAGSQTYTLYGQNLAPVSYKVTVIVDDNTAARINKFVVSGYNGEITHPKNGANGTITLNVPVGMKMTAQVPDFIEYTGKTIAANKTVEVDLGGSEYNGTVTPTNISYTVNNQNNDSATYDVKVNYIPYDRAAITKFTLAGVTAEDGIADENNYIDQTNREIHLIVPRETNLTSVAPTELSWEGMAINEDETVEKTFDNEGTAAYTVHPVEGDPVVYKVFVEKAKLTDALLLNYELPIINASGDNLAGKINQENKTVTFDLNEESQIDIDVSALIPANVKTSLGSNFKPEDGRGEITSEEKTGFNLINGLGKYDYSDKKNKVTHTVVSEDGSTENTYEIIVNVPYKATVAESEFGEAAADADKKLAELTTNIFPNENGVVTYEGDTVTVALTAYDGYKCDGITVVKDDNTGAANKIAVKDIGGGKYTFTMPDYNVKVTPNFKEMCHDVTIKLVDEDGNAVDSETVGTATVKYGEEEKSANITDVPWGEKVDIFLDIKAGYEPTKLESGSVDHTDNIGDDVDNTIRRIERFKHYRFTMPKYGVNLVVTVKKLSYKVTVSYNEGGGSASAAYNGETAVEIEKVPFGETVNINANPKANWEVANAAAYYTVINKDGNKSRVDFSLNPLAGEGINKNYDFTMPAGDVVVIVKFRDDTPDTYNVRVHKAETGKGTAKAAGSGDEQPNGSLFNVMVGTDIKVTLTPEPGYTVDGVRITQGPNIPAPSVEYTENADGTYTFTMPEANVDVYPSFKKIPHKVTVNIDPANKGNRASGFIGEVQMGMSTEDKFSFEVEAGKDVSITTTPADGYLFDYDKTHEELSIEHTDGLLRGNFRFTMPDEDVELTVYFKKQFNIICQQTEGGTVSSDKTKAFENDTFNVSVEASEGYKYVEDSLKVTKTDGTEVSPNADNKLKFTMPASDVSVTASFEKIADEPEPDTYKVTVICDPENGGTASANKTSGVKAGEEITVTAAANDGWKFVGMTSDEVAITDGKFTMPASDVTVTVKFEEIPNEPAPNPTYKVKVICDPENGGTARASKTENVKAGEKIKVSCKANDGYKYVGMTSDEVTVKNGEFTMPERDVTVTVKFEEIPDEPTPKPTYKVKVICDPEDGGTASASKTTGVKAGEEITVTATANDGWKFVGMTSDEVAITNGKFTMPTSDVTVTVKFEEIPDEPTPNPTYKVKVICDPENGGTARASKTTGVKAGEEITVTAAANDGFKLVGMATDEVTITNGKFTMPASDVTVTVKFVKPMNPDESEPNEFRPDVSDPEEQHNPGTGVKIYNLCLAAAVCMGCIVVFKKRKK